MRQDFINALDSIGAKNYKLRYIKKGKYGEEEVWVYPKNNPKQQRMTSKGKYLVYPDGSPVMESTYGLLIEKETLDDKEYFAEYVRNCMPKILE